MYKYKFNRGDYTTITSATYYEVVGVQKQLFCIDVEDVIVDPARPDATPVVIFLVVASGWSSFGDLIGYCGDDFYYAGVCKGFTIADKAILDDRMHKFANEF